MMRHPRKDGEPLSFTCVTIGDQARRPIAELAQQMFKEVGIDMQLEELPVASILKPCPKAIWIARSLTGPMAVPSIPMPPAQLDGANNFSRFQNDRADELLDMGLRESDPEARRYYDEIQEIIAEEVPFLFCNLILGLMSSAPKLSTFLIQRPPKMATV
ncbi:MAG: hypothetical protein R2932_57335 [Caldilineaceae bacterium]